MTIVDPPTLDLVANYSFPKDRPVTIEDLYNAKISTPSDISPLLPTLRALADNCDVVVEFGVRNGYSTTAFLASNCKQVISYDISPPTAILPIDVHGKWGFVEADTSKIETADIPICDLLFIDTLHTSAQVREELRQAVCCKKYLVFHDTYTFGCIDEGYNNRDGRVDPNSGDRVGILAPILEFLSAHPEWRVMFHTARSNGLTVLERIA